MPSYSTRCKTCSKPADVRLSFAEYDEAQAGTLSISCGYPGCGGASEIVFDPGEVSFVLKDGESGGWVSKAGKENAFRARHRKVMEKREKDHVFKSRLQPNHGGMMTHTWKDARDAAYESTFDKIKQEHGSQTAQQAASESAKTYDPLVSREVSG
jgi:hypothetical protein